MIAMALGSASVVRAQATEHVIHLWVDPHYGDDANAALANPTVLQPQGVHNGCPANQPATSWKPNDQLDGSSNVLLHAPWPFKTVTAAIGYLPPLPYTSSVTGKVWKYAIIHCLPGRYSRLPQADQDPHTGLYSNGETFPIRLPNRVSIQGTSALNTIFELDNYAQPQLTTVGPVFEFGFDWWNAGIGSFIDSVSIYGAPPSDPTNPGTVHPPAGSHIHPKGASAIYCGPTYASTPTLTNCMIFANAIGLLVDAPTYVPYPGGNFHEVTLVNNTFSMNWFGIWNGQTAHAMVANPPTPSVGVSKLLLLNNILDDAGIVQPERVNLCNVPPYGAFHFPRTWAQQLHLAYGCFDGIDQSAFVIASAVPQRDSNAYQAAHFNLQRTDALFRINSPTLRPGGPQHWPPGLDITTWTSGSIPASMDRGTLFVRDLMHNGGILPADPYTVACEWDQSPGDFRLSPAVAPATPHLAARIPPGNTAAGGVLNPLVNAGYFTTSFPITMANGRSLTAPPGYLNLGINQASWPYHGWMHDGEGFANRRVFTHPVYPVPHPPPTGDAIDIGADELDLAILAGQRFGTTDFVRDPRRILPPPNDRIDQARAWLLGPPATLTGTLAPNSDRPKFTRCFPENTDAFDPGEPLSLRWDYGIRSGVYAPSRLGIHPHLLPDVHPYWYAATTYSNPIWQHCSGSYNPYLYLNPTSSVINPAGALPIVVPLGFQWLDGVFPAFYAPRSFPYHTAAAGGPPRVESFGSWCQNQRLPPATGQDFDDLTIVPSGGFVLGSHRYSIEFENAQGKIPFAGSGPGIPGGSNLQSAMVFLR